MRASPIGLKQTVVIAPYLECSAAIRRVHSHDCGVVRQIKIGFADVRRSYTKEWAKYALQLTLRMTIKDVADLLGVTWDVIKETKKDDLRRRFANPSLKDVRRIAIDEICIGKGHRYVTLVMNLDTGAIIYVGDGTVATVDDGQDNDAIGGRPIELLRSPDFLRTDGGHQQQNQDGPTAILRHS